MGRVGGENEDAPRKVLALVISLPSSPLPSHHPSKASLSRRNLWEKRSEDVVGRSSAVGRSSLELGRKLTAFLQEGEGDATPPIFSFHPPTSLGNPLRAAARRAFHLSKKSLFFFADCQSQSLKEREHTCARRAKKNNKKGLRVPIPRNAKRIHFGLRRRGGGAPL